MPTQTQILQIHSEANWNALVKNNCSFTPLSLNPSLEKIFQKTFNWKYKKLLLKSNNEIIAFFPVVLLKNKLISIPHFSYGCMFCENAQGINNNNPIQKLAPVLNDYSSKKYELRSFGKLNENVNTDKVLSYIKLNEHNIIFSGFKSHVRRKIRKAVKNGLIIKQGKTELLKDFYKVLCKNSRSLGAPVLPISFFRNLLTDYRYGDSLIFVIYLNEKPIGSSFLLSYNCYFENTWFATLKKHNHLYTSYLLHWTMIKYACDNGGENYSFGRSTKDSGVHHYKKHWGTSDRQLYWNYSHPKRFNIRKQRWIKKIWKCIPLPVANFIGPYFAGRIY